MIAEATHEAAYPPSPIHAARSGRTPARPQITSSRWAEDQRRWGSLSANSSRPMSTASISIVTRFCHRRSARGHRRCPCCVRRRIRDSASRFTAIPRPGRGDAPFATPRSTRNRSVGAFSCIAPRERSVMLRGSQAYASSPRPGHRRLALAPASAASIAGYPVVVRRLRLRAQAHVAAGWASTPRWKGPDFARVAYARDGQGKSRPVSRTRTPDARPVRAGGFYKTGSWQAAIDRDRASRWRARPSFCANNYLGRNDPRLIAAARNARHGFGMASVLHLRTQSAHKGSSGAFRLSTH